MFCCCCCFAREAEAIPINVTDHSNLELVLFSFQLHFLLMQTNHHMKLEASVQNDSQDYEWKLIQPPQ